MDNTPGPSSFPPTLSYVSLIIGITSLTITTLNLLALYAGFLGAVRGAPAEAPAALASLRAQLVEEREALRQQARELRGRVAAAAAAAAQARRPLHPAHAGRARSSSRNGLSPRPSSGTLRGGQGLQGWGALGYSEQTLGLHARAVRDLWRRFRSLERPFLVPGGGGGGGGGVAWGPEEDLAAGDEKTPRVVEEGDVEMRGADQQAGRGPAACMYRCGLAQRFVWWRSKADVARLADEAQRVMLRRMEREVTSARVMVRQLRDGGDGPEELAGPWPDGGAAAAWATATSGRAGSRGPVPLGTRRRPAAENYNVYESSGSSSSTTGGPAGRPRRRPDDKDPRLADVSSEVRQGRPAEPRAAPELRYQYSGDGWRQGHFTRAAQVSPRGNPPPVLEPPRPSRPRTHSGYEGPPGPPSPYDRRR